jgi:hypothetical protein
MKRTSARRFIATSLALGLLISFSGSANASASVRRHFDGPGPIVLCADRVIKATNSLTEIDETSSAVVRVLDSSAFDFTRPVALGCGDDHLWVVDQLGNAVTEINAKTGRLLRVVQNPSDGSDYPNAIAVGRSHVWITNGSPTPTQPTPMGNAGNSVAELNVANGSLVRVINDAKEQISVPDAVMILGSHVWVGNSVGNALVELRSPNGTLVHVTKGSSSIY